MTAYGYSTYESGFTYRGTIYPSTAYNYYGISLYTPLNVNPFTATPTNYTTIMLQWAQPQGSFLEFRLLSNRYGYPVDENDGNILIDSTTFPGTAYADLDVIPGNYHYYGIYINNEGVWNRAGLASCLAPYNYASGARMFSLLPVYFQELTDTELTQVTLDDTVLQQFLNVIGWSMDYLRTQYDMLRNHLNDPMYIPLGDLVSLAGELGMPFQPEVPASLMRKALANWTHVCQERGTPAGIAENISLLTGYPVDLRTGRNMMLENDQAGPADPAPGLWTPSLAYVPGGGAGNLPANMVTYGNYLYTNLAPGGLGQAPTGTTSSNTYWQAVRNTTDPAATLANPATVGGVSTWEAIYPALDSGGGFTPPAGALVSTIGLPDPLNMSSWTHSAFTVYNKEGASQDIMLRSVSRVLSDMTGVNTAIAPDNLQVVKDGLPIPKVDNHLSAWLPSVRYPTDAIVIYDGTLFQALRASTGAAPPSPYTPLNQNSTFPGTVAPWTPRNGATVALSSAQVYQETSSMLITPNGTAANPGAQSESVAVIPGGTYSGQAWAYVTAGWSDVQVVINWYDAFGQPAGTSTGPATNASAATWTNVTVSAVAPLNAATAVFVVQLTGTPGGSVVSYWDLTMLSCAQTPEWTVLSPDNRLRLMLSGYTAQSLTVGTNQTVEVVPFAEFYDERGSIISSNGQYRLFPRVATAGTPGHAPNLSYDSFTIGIGTFLNGRELDTNDQPWTTQTGGWIISGYNNGCAYPAVTGTRSMATVTGLPGTTGAPVWLGVTFATAPQAGQDSGLVFRYVSTSSYWRAGMAGLYSVTGGASTLVGSYSTACQPGDRLTVNLAGNTITVYRNGAQVLTTSSSYNASATIHGITCEAVGV